ncbi:AraC family transcriptional regulator [Streptomyces sp. NPDC001941]|uniref:helix-turn-helix transcriptional regulator n=1 Tax=Streptomyces sp. NPDC001941 TaxID=3154659 RepID=UPI003330DE59
MAREPEREQESEQDRPPVEPALLAVRTESIRASHPDEATEAVSALYGRARFRPPGDGSPFRISLSCHGAGGLTLVGFDVRTEADVVTHVHPTGVFGHVRSGSSGMAGPGTDRQVRPGDLIAYPPAYARFALRPLRASVLSLPPGTWERAVAERGHDRAALEATEPVSGPAARRWLAVFAYAERLLRDPGTPLAEPLLNAAVTEVLARTALSTFPNATMAVPWPRPPGWVRGPAVRRAVAYADEHAHEPVTLTDLARAAGTGPRALQYAFRRQYGVTPLGYLRRVRLAHAHTELSAARPGSATTVAVVAARWGWASPGAFATAYRRAYGVGPAHTLGR